MLGKNVTQILTENDGCCITTDLVLNFLKDKLLMLLGSDEMWTPGDTHFPTNDVCSVQSDSK